MRPGLAAVTLCTLTVSLPTGSFGGTLYADPQGLCGGLAPCYATLQDAIDTANPDDTILLSPGLYEPGTPIRVSKNLTIVGPQSEVTPLPSQGSTRTPGNPATEAILDGRGVLSSVIVLEAWLRLEGVEIRGSTGDLILGDHPLSGLDLSRTILHDAGGAGYRQSGGQELVVFNAFIYETCGGIQVQDAKASAIVDSEIRDLPCGSGIQITGLANSGDCLVIRSIVEDVRGGDGIVYGDPTGAETTSPSMYLLLNRIARVNGDGISLHTHHASVFDNVVRECTGENGAIFVGHHGTFLYIGANNIVQNHLRTTRWPDAAGLFVGPDATLSTYTFVNNYCGNTPSGMTNHTGIPLYAPQSWWGSSDGPSGAGPGTGDPVSEMILFEPWATSPLSDGGDLPPPNCEDPVQTIGTSWGRVKALYR